MLSPTISPWIILAATALYGWVHSWLASHQFKRLVRQILGAAFADRWYRFIYNFFALVTLLPVLALVPLLPDLRLYSVDFPWNLFFYGLQGAAVVFAVVALLQRDLFEFLGLRQIVENSSPQANEMLIGGLYRWVRHPLYTAGFVFLWATPVMTRNLFALYIALSLYLIIGAYFEERKLLRELGEAYQRYRQTTPMFLPRPPRDESGV